MKRSWSLSLGVLLSLLFSSGALSGAEQAVPTKTLYQAASQGDIEQLKLHIARGADLDKADKSLMTALGRAVMMGRLEVVKLLVGAGANVNTPSFRDPPIVIAAVRMKREIAEFLLAEGADVNAKGGGGQTALLAAIATGQQELVEILVEKGADVNAGNDQGQTPLAAARRNRNIADFLRQKGASEPVNTYGLDPYGRRGLDGGMAGPSGFSQDYQSADAPPDILADPNAIAAKIAAVAGLAQAIDAVDAKAATEERGWVSRRTDNRAVLIRSAEKQFGEELAFLKGIATGEKAAGTVAAIDALAAKRAERYGVIGADLRAERRVALQDARNMSVQGRMRASRGRASRGAGAPAQGYGAPMGVDGSGPYGTPPGGPPPRRARITEAVQEPILDADTEGQLQAWLGANPQDKRSLLNAVHELDVFELDVVRAKAVEEKAEKTTAAIEGIMLARQLRRDRILAKMAQEDERLARLAQRGATTVGPTRSRRGRGTLQPQRPQQGQQPGVPPRRGRRGR